VKDVLATQHGDISLPAFLPDATRGGVRTLDSADLEACGLEALMVNVFHLSESPGSEVISSAGGIHRFMGSSLPIACDSGGFQIYSLAVSERKGSVTNRGFVYKTGKGKKRTLTPEKSVERQLKLGADIVFCLDHCTHSDADAKDQQESVEHTVAWAARCRQTFDDVMDRMGTAEESRPLLYAVVQGGESVDLRTRCADALMAIGFDGYGYGGWPVSGAGKLVDAVGLVAELTPPDAPKHGLGIGSPENVAAAFQMGYCTFDCTLPTRDARQGRLYVTESPLETSIPTGRFYDYLYIEDERYVRDASPVDPSCPCACCTRYTRSYLNHLFKVGESTGLRLATIHNLTFYARLMRRLRGRVG